MDYEAVIGLEIHAELSTESKMFCGCSTLFGKDPNTQTCPVCLGHPGTLPVINEKAIEYTIKIGLALNCQIAEFTQFHRKNYFYPDMPKDYQISQYDLPLCAQGELNIEMKDGQNKQENGEKKRVYTRKVGITRVHLEEDTGKLIHLGETGRIAEANYSLVDFNRAGIPLVEIVTEPDLRTPQEARAFVQKLKSILEHLEVSDCNMAQGSLRCDANISIRPQGETKWGTKTEIKNMNSFRSLERALTYEIQRQEDLLKEGGSVVQETRHWDEAQDKTSVLRTKEEVHDYRYFPEPDLVPMVLEIEWIEKIRQDLPELPDERYQKFLREYNLSPEAMLALTSSKAVGDYFEECMKNYNNAKAVVNWIRGELSYHLNTQNLEIDESAVTPKHLVQLLKLIDEGTISGKIAKQIFEEMFKTGKLPEIIMEEKGLVQITDEKEIKKIVDLVLEENPAAVLDLKKGKDKVLGFLVGQVMKLTKGKANPQAVNELLKEKTSHE